MAEGRPRSPRSSLVPAPRSVTRESTPNRFKTDLDIVKQMKQLPPLLSKSGRKLSSERRSEQATEAPTPPRGRPRQVRLSTHLTANSRSGRCEAALAGGGGRAPCRTEAARTPGPGPGVLHASSVAMETGAGPARDLRPEAREARRRRAPAAPA